MLCIKCISFIKEIIQRIVGTGQYGDIHTMATDTSEERPERQRMQAMLATLTEMLRRLIEDVEKFCRKRRGRLALSELTDDELRDIGVSRSEAMTEAAKSAFWR
jgi:uncharacterized protein YjiS (DUF1127 family)